MMIDRGELIKKARQHTYDNKGFVYSVRRNKKGSTLFSVLSAVLKAAQKDTLESHREILKVIYEKQPGTDDKKGKGNSGGNGRGGGKPEKFKGVNAK
jgi:hypothetical protein